MAHPPVRRISYSDMTMAMTMPMTMSATYMTGRPGPPRCPDRTLEKRQDEGPDSRWLHCRHTTGSHSLTQVDSTMSRAPSPERPTSFCIQDLGFLSLGTLGTGRSVCRDKDCAEGCIKGRGLTLTLTLAPSVARCLLFGAIVAAPRGPCVRGFSARLWTQRRARLGLRLRLRLTMGARRDAPTPAGRLGRCRLPRPAGQYRRPARDWHALRSCCQG
jgi:hypothetical protein